LKAYPLDPADDPAFLRCQPIGGARQIFVRHQLDIRRRGKDRLEFHYGEWDATRTIYVDGRKRPAKEPLSRMGYSVGHWESDTFIVETAGFNGKTILDGSLHPESEQMRVTERFHRRDFGHLDLEITFNDQKNYTRPFTIRVPHNLLADEDIFEMFNENEKDCAHIGKAQTK